ncbi:MAG: DUF302 domain-containing protein [Cocleimonas sp.]|nr:DUF302 domain-containing protein [Cocleimonas sp.]
MSDYCFSTHIDQPIDAAIETLKTILMRHHLGIVSEVNVATIIKTKLDEDMPAYRILGACNPKMAKSMIDEIPQAGALLPCTIVAREAEDKTVFDFMDPEVVLGIANNDMMNRIAADAKQRLNAVVADLEAL